MNNDHPLPVSETRTATKKYVFTSEYGSMTVMAVMTMFFPDLLYIYLYTIIYLYTNNYRKK